MKDLCEHIMDIAQNSTRAEADLIEISVLFSDNQLRFSIKDNGKGMPQDFLEKVTDPFSTTRTTRKVGLGLPFLKQNAEQTDGTFSIESTQGYGTAVIATFNTQHWDMLPIGDLAETFTLLIGGNPQSEFVFTYQKDENEAFVLDTREVKAMLETDSLTNLTVIKMLRELIANNIDT